MSEWKLDHSPRGEAFYDFRKKLIKRFPCYTDDSLWRYFTFLHSVGADVRNEKDTHSENIDCIQNGRFYSRSTVNAITSKYLERLARLKAETASALPDDTEFDDAARIVIQRAVTPRQNHRSDRVGKIRNRQRA